MCIACVNGTTRATMCLADPVGARPGCILPRDHEGPHENVRFDRWSDAPSVRDELVTSAEAHRDVERARATGEPIMRATARTIASWWHGPADPALTRFSTGCDMSPDAWTDVHEAAVQYAAAAETVADRMALAGLRFYAAAPAAAAEAEAVRRARWAADPFAAGEAEARAMHYAAEVRGGHV